MHPDFSDPLRREAIFALLDLAWPGLPRRIGLAAGMGWDWTQVSTPFVQFEGDRALSHVGVLDLPVMLEGEQQRIAGVHAVCTHPEHRRQGHYGRVMQRALAYVDERWSIAKLNTAQPEVYEPFGFRRVEQCRYRLERSRTGGGAARPLAEHDLPWIHQRLGNRIALSPRFAPLDPGWLLGIDEVLWKSGLDHLHAVGHHLVAWEIEGTGLQIYDISGAAEVRLEQLLDASPWPFDHVVFWMEPGAIVQDATKIAWPEDDVLMVRGAWPLRGPVAVSPLASH